MSEQTDTAAHVDPVSQHFAELWTVYIEQTTAVTKTMFESFDSGVDPQTWQRRWLDAMSNSMDAFLRSPVFLRTMKHHVDTLIQIKRRGDDLNSETTHSTRVAADEKMSELLERLKGAEESILRRLEHIEGRLEVIENKLAGDK